MNYRKANINDIDFLVQSRLEFTYGMRGIAVNIASEECLELERNCRQYFQQALTENSCDVILVEENGECIGMGIIFYYRSVPSSFNREGKNAYITSLYVKPEYRKRGLGSTIVEKLIRISAERGYPVVILNASELGKPLYEKLGFKNIENGMIYDGRS